MRRTALALINYIGCIGMAVFVTLIVEGTIGMILIYALVIALIVSLIMTLAVLRSISVQPVLSQSAVSKGDTVFFDIELKNSMILPTPAITVVTDNSAHFYLDGENTVTGCVAGKSLNTLRFSLTAGHSGRAHIRIKEIRLTDYLGIFSFKYKLDSAESEQTVSIYPDIPDVSVHTGVVKTTIQFDNDDDDEEESEETSRVPTGLAGYDHREYVPGDPIKRINWKKSSKRDILMVRLDEMIKGSGRTFLLDCPAVAENELTLSVRDNVIEGAIALLSSLLSEGREALFIYSKQGLWMSLDIRSMADIYTLQEELSDFEATENMQGLPAAFAENAKNPICFTAATSENYAFAESVVSANPDAMLISSYASSLPMITPNQWLISADFELKKI